MAQQFQPRRNTALLTAYDELDDEKTNFSQELPDAVSVSPWGSVATFGCAALAFGAEAAGMLGASAEPELSWALAGVNAAIAVGVALRLGFFRALAYLSIPLQIGALVWLGRDAPFSPVAFLGVLFPLATLIGTVAEPGMARRLAGFLVCAALLGGRAFILQVEPARDSNEARLEALRTLGVSVELPAGFQLPRPGKQSPSPLPLPRPDGRRSAIAFSGNGGELVGFVLAERARAESTAQKQITQLAEDLLDSLQAVPDDAALDFAPGDFAQTAHVSVLFRRTINGVDQKGVLLVAANAAGNVVGGAVIGPSVSETRLRLSARTLFTSVKLPSSRAADAP
ncbi:MAG: hypothetical protein ACK4N5_03605 [Myxococcales bacterium]